jgi:1,2-phenylacetyl-CoA epoxidase catalytic subunit
MVDKTQEAKKLQEKLGKKQKEILTKMKMDLRALSSCANKPNMDYDKICTLSQRIYNSSETLKNLK